MRSADEQRLSRRRLALLTGASLIAPILLLAQTLLARHDGLTGIPNRRTWNSELPVAMDRARRDGAPLSVAILDLDHFKDLNDQHGHQAVEVLERLRAVTPWVRPSPPASPGGWPRGLRSAGRPRRPRPVRRQGGRP